METTETEKTHSFDMPMGFRHALLVLIDNSTAKNFKDSRKRRRTFDLISEGIDWDSMIEDKEEIDIKDVASIVLDRSEMKLVSDVIKGIIDEGKVPGIFERRLWPVYQEIETVRTGKDPMLEDN